MKQPDEDTDETLLEIPGATERPSDTSIQIFINKAAKRYRIEMPPRLSKIAIGVISSAVFAFAAVIVISGITEFIQHISVFTLFSRVFVISGLILSPAFIVMMTIYSLRSYSIAESIIIAIDSLSYVRRGPIGKVLREYPVQSIKGFFYQRDRQGLREPQLLMRYIDNEMATIELFESARSDEKEWLASVLNVLLNEVGRPSSAPPVP